MATNVVRKLTVTADTSGLAKGATDVQAFGRTVSSTAAALESAKVAMSAREYKEFAASMAPAIRAEQQMAAFARQLEKDLKPVATELRKQEQAATKAATASEKRMLSQIREAEYLRKSYDATYRNALAYAGVEEQVMRHVQNRNLTVEQGNVILAGAGARYRQMGAEAKGANDNVRLTSNQMTNLGYQANDVATMLMMGASPFQIMASQAGQVVQALGDGPRGVKGSLAAIGSSVAGFARSIPAAGYAVAGLTAGVGALYYMTSGPEARSAEESLATFDAAIKRLEGAWEGAGEAARQHYEMAKRSGDSAAAALLDVGGSIRELQADLKNTIRDLNTSDELSGTILRPFSGAVSEARKEIMDLYGDLRGGRRSVSEVADELLRIRLDPANEGHARAFADEIRRALEPAAALERQIQSLNQAAAQLAAPKGTMGRYDLPDDVHDRMFGLPGTDSRFGDGEGIDAIREKLRQQREEAEKATKSVDKYGDAIADLRTSLRASVSGLQLQVDMFGQSEGAIAAARFEMDAMADATRAATDAGKGAVDPALIAFIKDQAQQYGALTDRIAETTRAEQERQRAYQQAEAQRLRVVDFEADLIFERSIMGLSDAEQSIRSTLHNLDVEFDSYEGQRLAAGMRQNDQLREMQDEMRRTGEISETVFDTMIDALTSGGSLVDNLIDAFAGLGRQFAALGAEKLFGNLFGGGSTSTATASGGIVNQIASGLAGFSGNTPVPVPRPTPAMVRTSQQLAQNVTESVSNNLLHSVLGAGKSATHINGLNTEFANSLTAMFAAAPESVRAVTRINSGFRSVARQAELFDAAVAKYGSEAAARRWVAPPGRSNHNAGNAADLGFGSSAARNWFHQNAAEFGLKFPMGHEPWHIEAQSTRGGSVSASQRLMRQAVSDGSIDAARRMATGAVPQFGGYAPGADPWNTGGVDLRNVQPGGTGLFSQAGMGVIGAGAGAFFNGMQSGPVGGALGGALSGYGAAGSIASAFPALAGIAAPLGIVGGAALGLAGSPIGGKKMRSADRVRDEHREAAFAAWKKGHDVDSDQLLCAA